MGEQLVTIDPKLWRDICRVLWRATLAPPGSPRRVQYLRRQAIRVWERIDPALRERRQDHGK